MGGRRGGGRCSQRERVAELGNDNAERESRAEERTYTPFLFVLWPSSVAGGEEQRGEDARGSWLDVSRCHIFRRSQSHAGAAAVSYRAASPVWEDSGLNRCLEIPNEKKNQER